MRTIAAQWSESLADKGSGRALWVGYPTVQGNNLAPAKDRGTLCGRCYRIATTIARAL